MAVLSEDGLVGKVVEVSRNTATVLLLSDPSCRVSARFLSSGVFGVVRGRGPSWEGSVICRMDYIDKNALVATGDEVVTSGFGGVFPPDLPIGYVDDVQRDPSGLYLSADLILRADLGNLRYVFVLDDGASVAAREEES
jgi:rod shape-determining protein MreC